MDMDTKERLEEEALLSRVASSSSAEYDEEALAYELDDFDVDSTLARDAPSPRAWRKWIPLKRRQAHKRGGSASSGLFAFHTPRRRRSLLCRATQLASLFAYIILCSIIICGVFFPSYSHPPEHYLELRNRVQELGQTANVDNEKIFIAASLYDHDGELLGGQWGQSVLRLVEILGQSNVFLSIYENDPDDKAKAALDAFSANLTCDAAIVTEHIDLHNLPHVSTPEGVPRLKRIAFLADVRNRALRPLEDSTSLAYNTTFDKLLYINDVMFDPIDAANLLLSTNVDKLSGRTNYRAACSMDFENPFKFYDTYATRDLEGYEPGVIFYPRFTGAGKAESRQDVIEQKDAVRVKSCWGGMVAFEAKWFQRQARTPEERLETSASTGHPTTMDIHTDMGKARAWDDDGTSTFSNSSLRFRAETDTFWDGSECCLIHADLSALDPSSLPVNESGIYMNPYIRVAYSSGVLPWLTVTRRFERLYTPIQGLINWIAGLPRSNPRQFQQPGDEVTDRVWVWDADSLKAIQAGTPASSSELHGHFADVRRTALPGGFCGQRKLLYINEDPSNGLGKWIKEKPPVLDYM